VCVCVCTRGGEQVHDPTKDEESCIKILDTRTPLGQASWEEARRRQLDVAADVRARTRRLFQRLTGRGGRVMT
jgi:hypothetical protein